MDGNPRISVDSRLNRIYGYGMRKKHTSSLRILRDATGLSQQEFANAIGSTKAIIENIEMGRSLLSAELQEKIVAFTGVWPRSLMEDIPRTLGGEIYTSKSWEDWRTFDFDEKHVEELIQLSCDYIRTLLAASHETPSGAKSTHLFRTLLLELNQWIFSRVERNNLGWVIERKTFEDETQIKRSSGKSIVAVCRYALGDNPTWQANDNPAWTATTNVEYSEMTFPLFVPFTGYKESRGGRPAFFRGLRQWRQIFNFQIAGKSFRVIEEGVGSSGMSLDGFNQPDFKANILEWAKKAPSRPCIQDAQKFQSPPKSRTCLDILNSTPVCSPNFPAPASAPKPAPRPRKKRN
jgi:transcriptional regulator with XRE-family HTH domain